MLAVSMKELIQQVTVTVLNGQRVNLSQMFLLLLQMKISGLKVMLKHGRLQQKMDI